MSTDFWLSRDDVRELDRRAAEEYDVPGVVQMENAGRGAAELQMRLNQYKNPTVVLCGPGNNGGDGFVIARHLDNHRRPVWIYMFADPSRLRGAAASNFKAVERSRGTFLRVVHQDPPEQVIGKLLTNVAGGRTWFIDALFGTGLTRPLGSPYGELVRAVNASGNPVLAVDIPSGLDCDTGEPLGPTVRATHTATFVAPKKGFLNSKSREWTGEVHVIDIGAPRKLIDEYRARRPA